MYFYRAKREGECSKAVGRYLQVSETAQTHKRAGLDGPQLSVPLQAPATDRHTHTE
jgi:hypothetical protein